jgi:hypothetical protein
MSRHILFLLLRSLARTAFSLLCAFFSPRRRRTLFVPCSRTLDGLLGRSEIRGLTWEKYDGETLEVAQAVNSVSKKIAGAKSQTVIAVPKTKRRRGLVPVIPLLKQKLDCHRLRSGNPQAGWIFANEAGNPLDLNNLLGRQILPALRRCEVCGKGQRVHTRKLKRANHDFALDTTRVQWNGWHSFRRGLTTVLDELGVEDEVITLIIRNSIPVMRKHYKKINRQRADEAMKKLAAAFANVATNQQTAVQ